MYNYTYTNNKKMVAKIGDRFGSLVIIEKPRTFNKQYITKCKCDCGNEKIVQVNQLKKGKGLQCTKCSFPKLKETEYLNFNIKKIYNFERKNNIELECKTCGKIKTFSMGYYNTKPNIECSDCLNKGLVGNKICITYLKQIKNNSIGRNLEFDLDENYLWNLFIKQNKLCALSGLPIELVFISSNLRKGIQTASLDRIDSNKGYIKGNVQWLHKDVNRLKSNFAEDKFLNLCKLITKNNGRI